MPSPDPLKTACASARAKFPADCSGAAKHIAAQLGPPLPAVQANALVDYFNEPKNGWTVVDETRAQTLADDGQLVIAGKKDTPNGHVVVVYPGGKKASGGYTYTDKKTGKPAIAANHGLYPRACSSSLGGWPGAVSEGEKTVFDSWGNASNYAAVKYWAAPPRPPIAQAHQPLIQQVASGKEVVAACLIPKGHCWRQMPAGRAPSDIHSGTLFRVRQINPIEQWVELVTGSVLPVLLRVTADELDRFFTLRR